MILGCDVALRRVALVCPADLSVAIWNTKPRLMIGVVQICDEVAVWAASAVNPGDVVGIELPVLAGMKNIQSTIKVAMVTGAMMAGLRAGGALVHPVAISSWKKEVCGHGNLSKEGVASWVREQHPAAYESAVAVHPFTQDALDAFCIGLWATALPGAAEGGQLGG